LQAFAELQPEDVQVAAHLANALFRVGRYQEAAKAFEKVLRLDPGRADHYYNLGLCFFSVENWDAALATWLTALAHDPKHAPTNKGLAVVYWKRGDYKQAWETVAHCQALVSRSIRISSRTCKRIPASRGHEDQADTVFPTSSMMRATTCSWRSP